MMMMMKMQTFLLLLFFFKQEWLAVCFVACFLWVCFGSVQMQSIMLVCRWQRWTPGHTHAHVYSALWVTCSFPYLLTTQHRNHNLWQHVQLHFLPRVRLLYFFPFFFFLKSAFCFNLITQNYSALRMFHSLPSTSLNTGGLTKPFWWLLLFASTWAANTLQSELLPKRGSSHPRLEYAYYMA